VHNGGRSGWSEAINLGVFALDLIGQLNHPSDIIWQYEDEANEPSLPIVSDVYSSFTLLRFIKTLGQSRLQQTALRKLRPANKRQLTDDSAYKCFAIDELLFRGGSTRTASERHEWPVKGIQNKQRQVRYGPRAAQWLPPIIIS
jgi:hypothetical protein